MRVRVRGPKGASTLTLSDEATVADLIREIRTNTGISSFDVKYGYPPKSLGLDQRDSSQPLSKLEVKLDGEQLTISPNSIISDQADGIVDTVPMKEIPEKTNQITPISLKREKINEVPEVLMPDREATLVLRVMPDDNSCLFRAVGSAVLPVDDRSMPELRSLVAGVIQAEHEIYTEVILERSPDDYCRWIQTPEAWGGAIELGILAKHFDIEICSIDVQSLRVDRFNEGRATRCILVFSGIHYDTIALSPWNTYLHNSQCPPEMDQRVWESYDNEILDKAVELCRVLQSKHYYTNTGIMKIKCNTCGAIFHGETQASKHAQENNHYNMSELNS